MRPRRRRSRIDPAPPRPRASTLAEGPARPTPPGDLANVCPACRGPTSAGNCLACGART